MMILSSFSCLSVVSFAAVHRGGQYDEENNLTTIEWEYDDETKVLTLLADITDFSFKSFRNEIEKVIVAGEVQNIPDAVFDSYPNLKEIELSVNVTSIGSYAFQNCNITELVLPRVDEIGDYAFYNCDSLKTVEVFGGFELGYVGKNVFKSCDALEEVTFGNGTIEIGEGMFEDCTALVSADIPDSVEKIGRLAFENCVALESINIPDSVEEVGEYAFYGCSSAKTAYIGHNVEIVGEYAFGKCAALESVDIMCAMPAISDGMFYGCSALKGLTNLPEGIKTIGKNAFKDCSAFAEIIIPATVVTIGDSAFDATVIKTIDIPAGVEVIGEGAFTNCAELTAINVAAKNRNYASVDGVLYDSAIENLICCPAGKTGAVVVHENTVAIGGDAFIGCTGLDVVEIPDSVAEIAPNAFNGCADDLVIKANCDSYAAQHAKLYGIDTDIVHANVSDWVVTVEPTCENPGTKEKQCIACGNVEETAVVDALGHNYDNGVVTLEPACEAEGVVTFTCQNSGCDNSYTTAIPAIGHNYDNGTVVSEATCEADGIKRFRCQNSGCYDYYDVALPATGHNLDDGTVKTEATCEADGEKVYKCLDAECNYSYSEVIPALGHKYDKGVVTLEPACEAEGVKTFTCQNADCENSYTEAIPATGHNYDAGVITKYPTVNAEGEITYTCQNDADHTYIVYISNAMFDGILATNEEAFADENGKLQSLTWLITDEYDLYIYANDTADEWASYRNNIVTATITGEATIVENGSFAYMPALEKVDILFSLGTIEAYAFQYCENLKAVFTGSLAEVQEFAFYHCSALESVDIYGGLPEGKVGRNIFLDCASLSEVILRNGTLEIGEAMFKGCSSLEEIILPESLLVIGDSAFDGTALKTIRIPTDVKEIQKGVFTKCNDLEEIVVDSKNDNYFSFEGVLYDMSLDTLLLCPAGKKGEVTVWDGTAKIAEDAFIGCDELTKVTIPTSVKEIADNAFNGCSDSLVIACSCDSYAAEFAAGRNIATELTHVSSQVWKITKEATCLEDGSKELVCSGCDYSYEKVTISALGHNYDNGVVTTKATCETDGVLTYTCTRTDCSDTYTEVIPATDHNYDDGTVKKQATCEEDGSIVYKCKNEGCNKSYTEAIPALGHKYDKGVVTLEATCEADGVKTFTCQNTDCEASYTEAIPALGHKYDKGVVTLEATCEADGVKTFTCQNDGCEASYTEAIPALTHNYVETVVREGTCIAKGLVEYKCEHCGDSYSVKEYGEHQLYSSTVRVEPTCDKDGKEGQMCALCHEFVGEVTVLPATSHTEGKWVVDKKATCTATGSKHKACTECGEVLATETIDALGHTEGDWEVDKKATTTTEGKKHKECTVCGETLETAKIAQLKCSRTQVQKVVNGSKGVKVTWNKVSGADCYRVYRKTKNGEWKYLDSTKKTSFVDDTAKSGTKYYYSVRVKNEAGLSERSNALSRYYIEDPLLKSVKTTKSGVSVKWTEVKGAEGYIVYRKTDSGSYKKIKVISDASKVSYTDKSAKKGAKCYYKVKAFYSKTTSDYSRVRSVTVKY